MLGFRGSWNLQFRGLGLGFRASVEWLLVCLLEVRVGDVRTCKDSAFSLNGHSFC